MKARRHVGLGAIALVVAGAVYAFVVEPQRVETTHVALRAGTTGDARVPGASPLRVMHLSDLHGGSPGGVEADVLAVLEREKPDVVVLTGDTSDRGTLDAYEPFLRSLRAPLGVFAVEGNWEHWRPIADERALYARAGITLLVNEARRLGEGLWIVGLDDATAGRPDLDRALREVPPGATTIALMHSPGFFDGVAGRVSVVLAGHTHGGQVRLPFVRPLWLPPGSGPYVQGRYELRGSTMYVSRGLGTSILPVRAFCRPEIAMVTLD